MTVSPLLCGSQSWLQAAFSGRPFSLPSGSVDELQQVDHRLDSNRSRRRYLGENTVKCAGLHRVMPRNRDRVSWRSFMP
jgi:hypothetical protein